MASCVGPRWSAPASTTRRSSTRPNPISTCCVDWPRAAAAKSLNPVCCLSILFHTIAQRRISQRICGNRCSNWPSCSSHWMSPCGGSRSIARNGKNCGGGCSFGNTHRGTRLPKNRSAPCSPGESRSVPHARPRLKPGPNYSSPKHQSLRFRLVLRLPPGRRKSVVRPRRRLQRPLKNRLRPAPPAGSLKPNAAHRREKRGGKGLQKGMEGTKGGGRRVDLCQGVHRKPIFTSHSIICSSLRFLSYLLCSFPS